MAEAEHALPAEKPRTLARRRQVLDAAEACFRRHGFHACSMAEIAAEAGMSVGHIYRYFPSKEAIIESIVRAEVDEILIGMAEFPFDAPDPRASLIDRIEAAALAEMESPKAPLLIEIRAEAARNPAIATLVREIDTAISAKLRGLIAAAIGRPLDPADLEARVEMFHLIFQGLALRIATSVTIDRVRLAHRVRRSMEVLLSPDP